MCSQHGLFYHVGARPRNFTLYIKAYHYYTGNNKKNGSQRSECHSHPQPHDPKATEILRGENCKYLDET